MAKVNERRYEDIWYRQVWNEDSNDSGLGLVELFETEAVLPIPPVNMPVTPQQLNSLTIYDGKTDVELWILHLERMRTQYGWTEPELTQAVLTMLQRMAKGQSFIASQTLKGVAYARWTDEPGAAADDPPVEIGLRTGLRERFGETITGIAAADAVSDLRQRHGEDVDDFAERVIRALDRKNHSYTRAEKLEEEYLRHFQHDIFTFVSAGLQESIRSRTLGAAIPPKTDRKSVV